MEDNVMENDFFTLTDEEGNEIRFEVAAECERDGQRYFAMIPVDDQNSDEAGEYVILKLIVEGDEEFLVTVDDDSEFDDVADYFDDLFSSEIDYDA